MPEVKKRYSPLKILEYIVPPEKEAEYDLRPGTAAHQDWGLQGPYIVYKESRADDPAIQQHERLHAGQSFLDSPALSEILKVFQEPGQKPEDSIGYDTAHPHLEVPAYRFMNLRGPSYYLDQNKEDLKKYPYAYKALGVKPNVLQPWQLKQLMRQQETANKYIMLMRSVNPEGIPTLEAAMPPELLRENVKSFPRPTRYPVKVKEVD
jgi:hypothetical protein